MTDAELARSVAVNVMGWEYSQSSPDYGKWFCRAVGDGHGWWKKPGREGWCCANCDDDNLLSCERVFGPGGVMEVMRGKDEATRAWFAVCLREEVHSHMQKWDNSLLWAIHITARDVCVAAVKAMEREKSNG